MEIKTTDNINEEFAESDFLFEPNKKWIAVDDLIIFIKEFQSKKKQVTDKILIQEELKEKIIDELK